MRRGVAGFVLFICLLAAGPLGAFQRETTDDPGCPEAPGVNCPHRGTPLAWMTFPVAYVINSDGSGLPFSTARDAISAAFSSWQGASGNGITYQFAGQSHSGSDGQDGQNTISLARSRRGRGGYVRANHHHLRQPRRRDPRR